MQDLQLKDTSLFPMVKAENRRQVEKWGIQDRNPMEWMCYLTEEAGELAAAIADVVYRDRHKECSVAEAIQVATLALKIAEMFQYEIDKEEK